MIVLSQSWMYALPVDREIFVVFAFVLLTHGFVLCFHRVLQIKTHCWENIPVTLVGNKCDMEDNRVVKTEEGEKLATSLGIDLRAEINAFA